MLHHRTSLQAVVVAVLIGLAGNGASSAQGLEQSFDPSGEDASPDLMHGAFLFHGSYCGPGNRGWGVPPVDALDRACMNHDRCTPDSGVPGCACNARLRAEASFVSRDPRQPDDLRALAGAVAEGSLLLPCRPGW